VKAATLVLWVVAEDLQALGRIRAGLDSGRAIESLMRENRVWGARQAVIRANANRLDAVQLAGARKACALIDRAAKGIGRRDPWDELAKLGLRLRARSRTRRAA
jgi:DNA polymerase-3 subunit delta